ncbi:MAG: hypothetical protein R3E88_02780 [Myxococcota bacterium]|nr:hypothetical protein [Myxococcales bacterium]
MQGNGRGVGRGRIGAATAVAGALVALLAAGAATANDDASAGAREEASGKSTDDRVDDLEQRVEVVLEEIDSLRKIFAVPEEGGLVSYSGLGPAASKVFQRDRGLSIGGYGEVVFAAQVGDEDGSQNELDALRGVLYLGYKFNDWIVFNSEIEFEHGGEEVGVEFLTLDFLLCEALNARAGLLLAPVGFTNEIHEPVFFFGANRPEVERRLIPSTWRENGLGIYGTIAERIDYRIYAMNGFRAAGFSEAGIRGGRQNGSEALADHFAIVARVDAELAPGVDVGGSIYHGKSGQNDTITRDVAMVPTTFLVPDAPLTLWEVHGQVRHRRAQVRGLFTQTILGDSAALSAATGTTIARTMQGGYVEVAYDVMPFLRGETEMTLEPFYRYERLDTQHHVTANALAAAGAATRDGNRDRALHVVGVSFKPHPQVVLKVDYRSVSAEVGGAADEVQAGIGFVF